ncbi:hypothetical protein, partial [Undibacterium sp. CCC3.4]
MTSSAAVSVPSAPTPPNPAPNRSRRWRTLLLISLTLLLMLVGSMWWALHTASGTRSVLAAAQAASGGKLRVSGVAGSLDEGVQIDELSLRLAALHVDISGLALRWDMPALWQRRLHVQELHISSLRIASAPDPSPSVLPQDLSLPLTLEFDQLALGRLQLAQLVANGKSQETLSLSALTGQFSYRAQQYRGRLAFTSPWGSVRLDSATLASRRPFALSASGLLQGKIDTQLPPATVHADLSGNLSALIVGLQASIDEGQQQLLAGDARLVLAPFSPQMLSKLHLDIRHLNPAHWAATAPQADLRLRADVHPDDKAGAPSDRLRGNVYLANAKPGLLSDHALPLKELSSDLLLQGKSLNLSNLQAYFYGEGQLQGAVDVVLEPGLPKVQGQLQLQDINLQQIDQAFQRTRIDGSIKAQTVAGQRITMQTELREARAHLTMQGEYVLASQLLKLDALEFQAEQARVSASGSLTLSGEQRFQWQGVVANFDPARWLTVPVGRLQAKLAGSGSLLPQLRAQVDVPLLQGNFAGQSVDASASLLWQTNQLQVPQLAVQWGKNSVHAQGNWGVRGNSLKLEVDAPELSALQTLLESMQIQLSGALKAQIALHYDATAPAADITLQAHDIHLQSQEKSLALAAFDANVQLAPGLNGALNGTVKAEKLRLSGLPEQFPTEALDTLQLHLAGTRSAHTLSLDAALPEKQKFTLSLAGGWFAATAATVPHWSGHLNSLDLSVTPGLHLVQAASLEIAAQSLKLGKLQLRSDFAQLSLEQFDWTPTTLATRGSMSEVQVLPIWNLLHQQDMLTGDLRLRADWDVELKDNARATIHLQRQSGDLRINDGDGAGTPVPLGMTLAKLELGSGGLVLGTDAQRINLTLQADGTRLGQWQLNAETQLSRQNGAWSIASHSPMSGKLHAALPDLQWVGPTLNPGLALKGKLNIDANLSGTLGLPHYQAQIAGRELELALAAEGLLLPNGSLDAHLEDQHLTLTNLQFSNTINSLPDHELFRDVDLLGKRGEFKASGEIDIGAETGSIRAQWQNFPLLQRKDRWLVVSGESSIVETNELWVLSGKVTADGAYFKLPKLPPPSLSSDVVVTRRAD